MTERAFDLAWTNSQVTLRQLGATEAEAEIYGRLASALVYADAARRASPGVWAGISAAKAGYGAMGSRATLPKLVLLRISDVEKIEIDRQLVLAHAYWRIGIAAELVILGDESSVYRQSLHERIINLVASGTEAQLLDKPGGIFVRLSRFPTTTWVSCRRRRGSIWTTGMGPWRSSPTPSRLIFFR